MSITPKILPPDYLDAAAQRIPRLEPFPAFRVHAEQLPQASGEQTELEIVEIDFDEVANLS